MENGINGVEKLIEIAGDEAKKAYMQRIWALSKDQIFHELMRVHGESSRLLTIAQNEINRLRDMLEFDDEEPLH
jgi:hypothetical protein